MPAHMTLVLLSSIRLLFYDIEMANVLFVTG